MPRPLIPALASGNAESIALVRRLRSCTYNHLLHRPEPLPTCAARGAHHAAIEDTIIFPAWKHAITPAEYTELTEQFENLEHKMFVKDGVEDALKKIAAIEQAFGLGDLNALTALPLPKLA